MIYTVTQEQRKWMERIIRGMNTHDLYRNGADVIYLELIMERGFYSEDEKLYLVPDRVERWTEKFIKNVKI